ncbi:MAG: ribose 5-phosphate isomerase B [bacterium]|nr:ribose 5-phosphate isomerase B [bacterium]
MKKVLIASDHGGFKLKDEIKKYIQELGYECEDLGCDSADSVDYPDLAKKEAEKVLETGNTGILICGTGIGMSMVANKFKGIRAALCHNDFTAQMAREHNDANILCMGERVLDVEVAKKITKIFLETPYSNEERHTRRIEKIEC